MRSISEGVLVACPWSPDFKKLTWAVALVCAALSAADLVAVTFAWAAELAASADVTAALAAVTALWAAVTLFWALVTAFWLSVDSLVVAGCVVSAWTAGWLATSPTPTAKPATETVKVAAFFRFVSFILGPPNSNENLRQYK